MKTDNETSGYIVSASFRPYKKTFYYFKARTVIDLQLAHLG